MKKYLLFFSIFILIVGTVNALEIIIDGYDDGNYTDWYKFDTSSNSNITIDLIDEFSTKYIDDDERVDIIQSYTVTANTYTDMGNGVLYSELYGDFYIKGNKLLLINDNIINSNCSDISFSFSGILISPSFGELEINNTNNYYCPLTGSSSISLNSSLLGDIIISDSTVANINITTFDSRGGEQDISISDIFDNKKISINGLINLDDTSGIISDYTNNTFINVDTDLVGEIAKFTRTINKNLVKYTKGLIPKTATFSLNSFNYTKKIFYYNFEGQEESISSNVDNKGKILKLEQAGNIMGVYNQQLLYVKGGNLYIKENIKNNTNKSQLVIVVKRDSKNRKNGGNIYIDPDVTNIDAILVAEGSIISYGDSDGDGNNEVLNAANNTDKLRKQLLIYGSVITKNTFGQDEAVYGTDDYIENGGIADMYSGYTYNLAKLRSFQTMLNDDVSGDCNGDDLDGNSRIVARGSTRTVAILNAFAGNKRCYLDDDVSYGLRSTDKLTPLVIEYNPILQTDPHFILEK